MTQIELPCNSKGEPWTLDCRFPMQQLIRNVTPADLGSLIRIRSGDIYRITAFRPDSELKIELTKLNGKSRLYTRVDGLALKQTWCFGNKLSGDDIVSFDTFEGNGE